MKKVFGPVLLVLFCFLILGVVLGCDKLTDKDDIVETNISMEIDHYMSSSLDGEQPALSFRRKSEANQVPANWENFYAAVKGFDYKWGHLYSVEILERKITDDNEGYHYLPRYEYELTKINSDTTVDASTGFKVYLKAGFNFWLTKEGSDYYVMDSIKIDCATNSLCSAGSPNLDSIYAEYLLSQDDDNPSFTETVISGDFQYASDYGSLVLQSLTTE
ncbi:MAG: DUF4377 domain-containing protein [bacterium]|nr:DUF4377 domain-containing protein [bacterium]